MYIHKAKIQNIRSIIDFEIEFENPAGWHVLIGDNGAGKSTIIRSMALALVGQREVAGLRANLADWINKGSEIGRIRLNLLADEHLDRFEKLGPFDHEIIADISVNKGGFLNSTLKHRQFSDHVEISIDYFEEGFFSAAYGPYRRFEGGNPEWEKVFNNPSFSRLAAHLSVFGEDVALTEAITWLRTLQYQTLEALAESEGILENLTLLINSVDFLPHNTQLAEVGSRGVFFQDANGLTISVNEMSDGYRSILSMTFELLRQLIRVYGEELVFRKINKGEMLIDLPGVVLIDEIDAHLHPTWQTRIGQWFLKYFPNLQFIVTTHSPLVCRAAEKGSIWRLAAPGSEQKSGQILGRDRERLIYGNILDAYGTEVFGENVSISEESDEMLNRLAELNVKSLMGEIDETEHIELESLKAVLPTESKL